MEGARVGGLTGGFGRLGWMEGDMDGWREQHCAAKRNLGKDEGGRVVGPAEGRGVLRATGLAAWRSG
jgi:hypothetical protein